jgi:hypothetical protein
MPSFGDVCLSCMMDAEKLSTDALVITVLGHECKCSHRTMDYSGRSQTVFMTWSGFLFVCLMSPTQSSS